RCARIGECVFQSTGPPNKVRIQQQVSSLQSPTRCLPTKRVYGARRGHQECENDDGKRTYASTIMVATNKRQWVVPQPTKGGNLRGPITGHDQRVLKWTFGAAGAWGHHASSIAATTSAAAARLRLSGLRSR